MKRFPAAFLCQIEAHLRKAGVSGLLFDELLDHLATEAAELIWEGLPDNEVMDRLLHMADLPTLQHVQEEYQEVVEQHLTLTDIVFEHRNKAYGAYALRRDYADTMLRATLIGIALFSILFLLPQL